MANWTPSNRIHLVLVPGFGGFDALGQVEYYSRITPLIKDLRQKNHKPVVLHYFDNLPTAAVITRAERLRKYLAKRIARGDILNNDKIVLVGHSTAGLDIRQLIWDLEKRKKQPDELDGGVPVHAAEIRRCLDAVVFLSVPHWGTNIADWVGEQSALRRAVIAGLRAAVAGSQVYLLDLIESAAAGAAGWVTGAGLVRAFKDALTEANGCFPGSLSWHEQLTRTADAQEAASELELFFQHMDSDFHVINDLSCVPPADPHQRSPAHFSDDERKQELQLWKHPRRIRTLSYATVGRRVIQFRKGRPGCKFELSDPCTYPETAKDRHNSAGTDFIYRLCYAACAGGPFRWPKQAGQISRVLGPAPPLPLQLWDNDGIVNTGSMLWPLDEIALVQADHLDIIGHCQPLRASRRSGRTYQAYDSFQSASNFTLPRLRKVWTEIFDFAINSKTPAPAKGKTPKPIALAATVGAGC